MRSSNLVTLAFAICGAALAIPPLPALPRALDLPSGWVDDTPSPTAEYEASNTPDCSAIEEYCKCLDGDFNCETDPSCEWCRDHDAWKDPPPPSSSNSTSTPPATSTLTSTPLSTSTT
ncbi:hypothetical protein F5Y06DRAFT_266345 [Hypoxylon sp. FL0890]|nr:hypothetical protein F5Y06DRAFT_266345 [Hypoxylon sp. FL0890]